MDNGNVLSLTEKALLDLLANSIFSADRTIDKNVDWSEVWKEANLQAVSVLAFSDVEASDFPVNLKNEIRQVCARLIAKNMYLLDAHAKLDSVLKKDNIPYTILKGFACARYYPDYVYRLTGDVDFLINPKDIDRVSEMFVSRGYEISHENHDYHRVFIKDGVRYEMHFEPSGIPSGEAGVRTRSYLENTLECAKRVSSDFGNMRVPFVFHHGLIILMHTVHHLTSGGIGLRHLCDWAVFVNSLSDDEFCALFEKPLRKIGMWRFACILTQTAVKYLGCGEKKWTGEKEDELTFKIIRDIFDAGNFGQKDEKRSQESLLISSGKGEEKKKSMPAQLLSSMNKIAYQKCKAARKFKILLPMLWLFYGGRYIIRMLMGKRPKIHPIAAKNEAEKRMEIYEELKIYTL